MVDDLSSLFSLSRGGLWRSSKQSGGGTSAGSVWGGAPCNGSGRKGASGPPTPEAKRLSLGREEQWAVRRAGRLAASSRQ